MLINNGIVSSNDLKIIQSLIPVKHSKARPKYSMQAKYITVHNTGNAGATGKQNADYAVNQNEYKSWHFTVGNNEVYQHLPITESGWHCGDGENGTGNRNSIGIEIIRDLETIIRQKVNSNNLEIVERDKGKYRFVTLDYIEKRKNVVN